ncbi:hypothetical protein GTY86_35505 [Streptomyces sp. SID5770]|uniref:hypothetical protein n=1 Tax=Streptomyces sp. SID5770 TaxID=2690308 RepID=UPI00136EA02F|nr:hypothetical protein [Streptomyces sp. SID5770]MZE53828.1 hypothetical protein [Streptomyces sp. SID5770]MZE56483.1 hypothetical protein [Streptomyces sp. SID5770]
MPLTPNQGYPYPAPADPNDVPGVLQALAESIDTNLAVQAGRVRPRAMAQFLGTVNNVIPGTALQGSLTWQLTDFNTVAYDPVQQADTPAVRPFTDAATTALRVQHAGFWFIYGTVQCRSVPTSANLDELGMEILRNGSATPANSRSGSHDVNLTAEPTFLIDAACGLPLAAGDTISLRGLVRRSSGTSSAVFGRRSITLLRMTES